MTTKQNIKAYRSTADLFDCESFFLGDHATQCFALTQQLKVRGCETLNEP